MIHLADYGAPDGTALCGAENVRTMSHHEVKRGRISCDQCLAAHTLVSQVRTRRPPKPQPPQEAGPETEPEVVEPDFLKWIPVQAQQAAAKIAGPVEGAPPPVACAMCKKTDAPVTPCKSCGAVVCAGCPCCNDRILAMGQEVNAFATRMTQPGTWLGDMLKLKEEEDRNP